MINKAAYKGQKRQKERARLQKVEEKRLRRLAKHEGDPPDTDGDDDDTVGDVSSVPNEPSTDMPTDGDAGTP